MYDEPTDEDYERLYIEAMTKEAAGDPERMLEYFGDNPKELFSLFNNFAMASSAGTNLRQYKHLVDARHVYESAAKAIAGHAIQAKRKEAEEQAP